MAASAQVVPKATPTRTARSEETPCRCTVERNVAQDHMMPALANRKPARPDNNLATRKPLTYEIICLPGQHQLHTRREEPTEGLASRAW